MKRNITDLIKKGVKFLTDSDYRFLIQSLKGKYDSMPDEEYLRRKFKACMGMELNLDNPQTFNEKLQWLKLYDRKPEYTKMVDKYEAKKYVADIIGEEHIIPTLGVWADPDDIDFDALPNQFVLKCTHNSGLGMCICKDKSKLDIEKVKAGLRKGLSQNYYLTGREWPYKDVKPRIIVEKYMVDESGYELKDYKFFCFDGEPKVMLIATDRQMEGEDAKFDFYDMDFNHLPFIHGHPNATKEIKHPHAFETMKNLAKILSKNIISLRVDFYEINKQVYFGELTFFPGSGMMAFTPEEWDYKLGNYINIPQNIITED